VLSSTAPLASLRAAIDRALRNRLAAGAASRDLASPEHVHALMSRVADEALRAMALPGAAVYLRAPQDSQYRALFKWVANESLPESPHHVPEAFATAQRTGEVVVIRDLASAAIDGIVRHDAVRGLVAAPIIFEAQAVGAICVFDVQPLKVTDAQVAALAALGREALSPQAAGTAADKGSLDTRQFRDRVNDRAVADATRLPPSVDFPPVLLERSGGEFAVARELARARREGRQLSVVMFDVASSLSREAAVSADDRLPLVADSLLKAIRQSDLPIRWSVSELLVVLPGLGAVEARKVAERVRAALFAGSQHSVAISGGVAEIEGNERFSSVIDRARERVSLAVVRGHNRIL
jgi:GGDEF domain-containing protein